MMTLVDIKEQLEKLDLQIISLLEERARMCAGHNLDSDEEMELLSLWLEEAAERGMDEARMEKVGKLTIAIILRSRLVRFRVADDRPAGVRQTDFNRFYALEVDVVGSSQLDERIHSGINAVYRQIGVDWIAPIPPMNMLSKHFP